MADMKTNLRELSVAVTIGLLKRSTDFSLNELYIPNVFFKYANELIENDISSVANLYTENTFTAELKQIISNGYQLGNAIYNNDNFIIDIDDTIKWLGNDTQKDDPVDITVGDYKFSLKEDSFILENMGLYKLLNCYTGSHYTTRHIFSDYARTDYEEWFSITWREMLALLSSRDNYWEFINAKNGKKSTINVFEDFVILNYYEKENIVFTSKLPYDCSLSAFETKTVAKTREKVFAKFINNELSNNDAYNTAKRNCAISATEALAAELNENLNPNADLARFLRIHNFEYYYAKTTTAGTTIYRVPSIESFGNDIVIESIVASVPDKQANILTKIKNTKTNQTLTLRNECRFSHGQFNGTPEAKMYYEHGGSLLVIYESI